MLPLMYLAGPINALSDSEAIDWRREVMEALAHKFNFLDPMARDFRGIEGDHTAEIVEGDFDQISLYEKQLSELEQTPATVAFLDGQISVTNNGISIYVAAKNSPDPKLKEMAAEFGDQRAVPSTAYMVGFFGMGEKRP
mgnify:CR=1 FL=1